MEEYKAIHTVLLDMMKKVASTCDKLKIPYYLVEGSCLGAVRHQGFIPWDDDLDVAIPFDCAEEFCKLAPPLLGNTIKIYGGGFVDDNLRVCNENIEIERPANVIDKEDKLIHPWIDIFVLYGLPKNIILRYFHYRRLWFWQKVFKLSDQTHVYKRERDPFSNLIIKLAGKFHTEKMFDSKKALYRMNIVGKRYRFENSKYVMAFPTWYATKEIMPKSTYGNGVMIQFEDTQFRVPSRSDAYLKQLYGDYMELPPPVERNGKHKIKIVKGE